MEMAKLRAWWSHRQGLDGSLAGRSPREVLEKTGWARSVGGSGPYLGLFARSGAGRDAIDRAVADLEIHELPSARGCTYVLPRSAFALGLKVAHGCGADADMKTARKLGVTDAEVDKLCKAILDALRWGPMDPEQLRAATGGAARNLGEEGKKKGMITTLPLALGRLQVEGEIRRIPVNGRLDQQRYRYALWRPNPLDGTKPTHNEPYSELGRLFFSWIGPATAAEFGAFAGLGVKASKAALEPLHLKPIETGDDRLVLPELHDELHAFKAPKDPQYVLVSSIDGILLLRRDLKSLLADQDLKLEVMGEEGRAAVGSLTDLPSLAILDRGRLVGLWEYDPEAQSIAWMSFIRPPAELKAAVRRTQDFARSDLGDIRSFSLDSPKSRKPRIESLRKM